MLAACHPAPFWPEVPITVIEILPLTQQNDEAYVIGRELSVYKHSEFFVTRLPPALYVSVTRWPFRDVAVPLAAADAEAEADHGADPGAPGRANPEH